MDEMVFKDAGKKIESLEASVPTKKYYPRFSVDLDQFPGLAGEVDEKVELHLRGRICQVEHSDYRHCMEVEVEDIATPKHTHESENTGNEADRALKTMKRGY